MEFARSDAWQQRVEHWPAIGRWKIIGPQLLDSQKVVFFLGGFVVLLLFKFWFPPYKRYGSHYSASILLEMSHSVCQEWRCYRRLSHLRHGLHDPIKVLLGFPAERHVSKSWERPEMSYIKIPHPSWVSWEYGGRCWDICIYIYIYVLHINWCRMLLDVFAHLPIIYTFLKFLGGIWKYRMIWWCGIFLARGWKIFRWTIWNFGGAGVVPCDSMAWPDPENGVQRLSENASKEVIIFRKTCRWRLQTSF